MSDRSKIMIIGIGCLLMFIGIMINRSNHNANIVVRQDNPVDQGETEMMNPSGVESESQHVYEYNISLIKQYVEAVYNQDGTQDPIASIQDIVSQDILEMYRSQFHVDAISQYETKVHDAEYTANENTVIALFNLETITESNNNEQQYLLEASIKNGVIDEILIMTMLRP